jgi:lipid-A-disaccharide synthase
MLVAVSSPELSGRLLAAAVREELTRVNGGIEFAELIEPGEPGPVLGFWEGVKAASGARRALRSAMDRISRRPPDVLLLVAFPGLNLRLGAWARRSGIPTVYLAPPQIWAWGAGRAKLLRRAADRVVCLYPFEPPILRKAGVDAVFLGYPLLDTVLSASDEAGNLERSGVVLLPGSRPAEVAFHRPLFEAAMRELGARGLAVGGVWVEAAEQGAGVGLLAAARERYRTIVRARAATVVSGTTTLETALLGVPQVVSYHLGSVSRLLARMLVRTKYFALPNILAAERVVPESLDPTVMELAVELEAALRPERQEYARELARRLAAMLGPTGANRRIARLLFETAQRGASV